MANPRAAWPARIERWRDRTSLALVLAGAFAIPLVFRRDPSDMFRLPKALFLRGEAILIVAITLAALLLGAPRPRIKWRDPWLLMPLGTLAIFILVTLTSTNRLLSTSALASAVATAIVFFATVTAARSSGWLLAAFPLAAAVINALLVVAQELHLWMPFGEQSEIAHHIQCTALIGNPNEIGGYLGGATLAALALLATNERWRMRITAVAAVLGIALLFSQTLTAIVAFAIAIVSMMALVSRRTALRVAVIGVAAALLLIATIAPFRERASNLIRWTRAGDYNAIATERFTPFVAAWAMFTAHPLTGAGPGAFAWQYYDHKIRVEQRYPSLRNAYNRGTNYGDVHNDHLQALAEGGLLGYAAFAAVIVAFGLLSFAIPDAADPRHRFARRLAFPLAVFFAVLSIAQFPMETTVVRSLIVHFAALCVGWRNS